MSETFRQLICGLRPENPVNPTFEDRRGAAPPVRMNDDISFGILHNFHLSQNCGIQTCFPSELFSIKYRRELTGNAVKIHDCGLFSGGIQRFADGSGQSRGKGVGFGMGMDYQDHHSVIAESAL